MRRISEWLSITLLSLVMLVNAWLVDDAYITFRTVVNAVNGHGLVWNIGERVQVYTHPLWMFLITGLYAVTSELFFSVIVFSWVVSLGAFFVPLHLLRRSGNGRSTSQRRLLAVLRLHEHFVQNPVLIPQVDDMLVRHCVLIHCVTRGQLHQPVFRICCLLPRCHEVLLQHRKLFFKREDFLAHIAFWRSRIGALMTIETAPQVERFVGEHAHNVVRIVATLCDQHEYLVVLRQWTNRCNEEVRALAVRIILGPDTVRGTIIYRTNEYHRAPSTAA